MVMSNDNMVDWHGELQPSTAWDVAVCFIKSACSFEWLFSPFAIPIWHSYGSSTGVVRKVFSLRTRTSGMPLASRTTSKSSST